MVDAIAHERKPALKYSNTSKVSTTVIVVTQRSDTSRRCASLSGGVRAGRKRRHRRYSLEAEKRRDPHCGHQRQRLRFWPVVAGWCPRTIEEAAWLCLEIFHAPEPASL